MKAKEYIAKYKESLESDDYDSVKAAATKLVIEFSDEASELLKTRGVKRNSALVAVLKEQNDKWNAVARAFPDVLARDGFKMLWLARLPYLKFIWG